MTPMQRFCCNCNPLFHLSLLRPQSPTHPSTLRFVSPIMLHCLRSLCYYHPSVFAVDTNLFGPVPDSDVPDIVLFWQSIIITVAHLLSSVLLTHMYPGYCDYFQRNYHILQHVPSLQLITLCSTYSMCTLCISYNIYCTCWWIRKWTGNCESIPWPEERDTKSAVSEFCALC